MHFPIIELLEKDQERGQYETHMWDDATLGYWTDYYGEKYSEHDRKELIKRKWLKEFFEGIAEVDAGKETITFLSAEEIRKTLINYFHDVLHNLETTCADCEPGMRFFHIRMAGYHYHENSVMFWKNGCGFTSMQFIEDATFYAGQTFKIGNIYDAHY